MPDAGAVGGIVPATPTGPHDGGAKGAVPHAEPRDDGKHHSLPMPRSAEPPAPEAAVVLAATLAGLRPGQELRGLLRFPPALRPGAWLATPDGGFLIDPAPDLPPESELTVVLTRADRTIAALLMTADGEALDPPVPVRLTLMALPERDVPAPATPEDAGSAPAAPGAARTPSAPAPAAAPPAAGDDLLNSLLPGETLALRGGTPSVAPPPSPPPSPEVAPRPGVAPAPAAPAATPPATPAAPGAPVAPTLPLRPGAPLAPLEPGLAAALLPVTEGTGAIATTPAQSAVPPSPTATTAPADHHAAATLAALMDTPVLGLRLAMPGQPQATVAVSLLAAAGPGEVTPLTHPAPNSPLARLAATGRLVTAVVLPADPAITAATTAPAAAARSTPDAPAPAAPMPGTTPGSGSIRTEHGAPAAEGALRPPHSDAVAGQTLPGKSQETGGEPRRLPDAQTAPSAPAADPPQPLRLAARGAVLEFELPARLPLPDAGTRLVLLVTRGREALQAAMAMPARPETVPSTIAAAHTSPVVAEQARPEGTAPRTDSRPISPREGAAPSTGTLPAVDGTETAVAPASPLPAAPMWMPGMGMGTISAAAAPAAPLHAGEALLLAVMQALGRRGFSVGPASATTPAQASPAAVSTEARSAPPASHPHMPSARAGEAAGAAAAGSPGRAADTMPDALPLALTLHTPQGPMPLTLLVWQPPPREEKDSDPGSQRENSRREVCFALEVEFESLGPLRLRGTVTPRTLNLAVETEQPLGAALQHHATQDFTAAVEAGGMTGTLVFRHRQGR